MPSTIDVDLNMGVAKFWNVNVKVGFLGATKGMDVKMIQFILYVTSLRKGSLLPLSQVHGVWNGHSAFALREFEKDSNSSPDGSVDPLKPGQNRGSLTRVLYKMLSLQQFYLMKAFGFDDAARLITAGVTADQISETLMAMPEDNDDMPSDLRFAMQAARDGEAPVL